jgi:hypothetical protein
MNESAGNPISLLFMIGLILFVPIFLLGILPWQRRKKKKVSLQGQLRFAAILIFIYAGWYIMSGLNNIIFRKELIDVWGVFFRAGLVALGFFVIKKSIRALISVMGLLVLNSIIRVVHYFGYFEHIGSGTNIASQIGMLAGAIIGTVFLFSPLLRGVCAIRDLRQYEKEGMGANK